MAGPVATVGEIDPRFSDGRLQPREWPEVERLLTEAGVYLITTVRADGRPHTVPLLAVWLEGALHVVTGPAEQKARNLAHGRWVTLATGNGRADEGFDLVVEGEAVTETDDDRLRTLARMWAEKYPGWAFEVREGGFWSEGGGRADVYRIAPAKVFGFARGDVPGQMRWRFAGEGR